nr:MAG: hypothetical protein DIU70_09710 [Bacillota bacterium]
MRKFGALLLALAMAGLTACGGGKAPQGGDGGQQGQSPEQKVVIAVSGEPTTLDPHKSFSGNVFGVTNQIYESLLARNPDGSLAPRLATEYRALDPTTWEFKLREGVKFHDGTPFDAQAVKFSLDRLRDPATRAPGAYVVSMIKEVQVVDDHTVRIVTDKPFAPLPAHLAHPVAAIVSPAAAQQDLGKEPVGTGPFKFKELKPGESVTLVAYPDYWGGKPKIETVVMRVIPEAGTQIVELKAGTVDLITSIPPERFAELESDPNLTATRFLGWGTVYLGFNMKEGPLSNPKVRQAIAHALDRKAMVETLRQGMAQEATAMVPPRVAGAPPGIQPVPYDPDRARQLLQEAGVTLPLKVKLHTYDNTETRQIAGAIQAQLKEIGIDVEVSVTDFGTFDQDTRQPDHGLFLSQWGTVTMDADYAYWAWLHSSQQEADNRAFYRNPQVDQWLEEARATTDLEARTRLYTQIEQQLQQDLPYLPLYYPLTAYAKNRRLQGEVYPFAFINLDLRQAEIVK